MNMINNVAEINPGTATGRLPPEMVTDLDLVISKVAKISQVLHADGNRPQEHRVIEKTFPINTIAKKLDKPRSVINKAIEADPTLAAKRAAALPFGLDDFLRIQDAVRGTVHQDEAIVVAVQTSKGGVGKTTLAATLGQCLALKGYRVLIFDGDPQGSLTSTFGVPQDSIAEKDTLVPYIIGQEQTLDYCIKKTFFPGIDLIPSNLVAHTIDHILLKTILNSVENRDKALNAHRQLKSGLATVADRYDVIICDSVPAHSMITANIIFAADYIVSPSRASSLDLDGFAQYTKMVRDLRSLHGLDAEDLIIKMMITVYDATKAVQYDLAEILRSSLGTNVFTIPFPYASLIQNCFQVYRSPYELTPAQMREMGFRMDYKAMAAIDSCLFQIERDLLKIWDFRKTARNK